MTHTPDIRDEDRLTLETLDRALRDTFGYSAEYRTALLKDWLETHDRLVRVAKDEALEEAAEHLSQEGVLDLLDRNRELEAALQRVHDLHGGIKVDGVGTFDYCETCDHETPCPTRQALGDQK